MTLEPSQPKIPDGEDGKAQKRSDRLELGVVGLVDRAPVHGGIDTPRFKHPTNVVGVGDALR